MTDINITAFNNDYKKEGSNQPDLTGTNKDKTLRVAVWKQNDKNGKDSFSIKITDNNYKKQN